MWMKVVTPPSRPIETVVLNAEQKAAVLQILWWNEGSVAARTTTAMRGSKAGQQAHNKQAGQQAHNNQTDNANVSDLAQHEL